MNNKSPGKSYLGIDKMTISLTNKSDKFDYLGSIWTLIRTDFKVRFHGSAWGFLWTMLKPIFLFITLFCVFSFIFQQGNYSLNLIAGLFIWNFFSESSSTGLMSLFSKGYLITRLRFPVWIIVVTAGSNALIALSIFSVFLFIFLSIGGHSLALIQIGLFIFYLICLFFIVLGFSLSASVLFIRFRDLNQVWDVILNAGFFVAPIIYPLNIIPEKYHFFLYIWPPTPVIQFSRSVIIDGTIPTLRGHLLLILMTLVILEIGIIIYRVLLPKVVEKI